MKGIGILLGNDFDLKIQVKKAADGKIKQGLLVGQTLFQNQALILLLQQGELKLSPITGVGFDNSMLDIGYLSWERKVRRQMEKDGQQVKDVSFDLDKKLVIDASYH